jgi:hypothetical protein
MQTVQNLPVAQQWGGGPLSVAEWWRGQPQFEKFEGS